MKTFCITFGQAHPLVDNWIEVEADFEQNARLLVLAVFGNKWSMFYPKEEFNEKYFPGGKVGRTIR